MRLARAFAVSSVAILAANLNATPAYSDLSDASTGGRQRSTPATTAGADSSGNVVVTGQQSRPGTGALGGSVPADQPAPGQGPVISPEVMAGWALGCQSPGAQDSPACKPAEGGARPAVTPAILASATARLKLPAADPQIGPDPAWNEWHALAVGFPVWFWADLAPRQASITEQGIAVTIEARPAQVTFELGDGATLTCVSATAYDRARTTPGSPSPDCGHIYTTTGSRYVTARVRWQVRWSAAGVSGTFTTTRTGSRTLEIIALESVING